MQYRIGIVSNNRTAEQEDKLRFLNLSPWVDALVTSEEVGVPKPDTRIFQVALKRLHCCAEAAVMVGDNWQADVIGARQAGIRSVWFNRFGDFRPLPDVAEITSLGQLLSLL